MKKLEKLGTVQFTKTGKVFSMIVTDGNSFYYLEAKPVAQKFTRYSKNITYTNIGGKNNYYYDTPTPLNKVSENWTKRFSLSSDGLHYKFYTGFKVSNQSLTKWLSSKDNTYLRDEKSTSQKRKDDDDRSIEIFNFQYAGGKIFVSSTEKVETLTRVMFSILGATKEEVAMLKEANLPLVDEWVCEDAHLIKTYLQQVTAQTNQNV